MLGYTDEELRQITPLDITLEGGREKARMRLAELQQGKVRSLRRCENNTVARTER